MSFWTPIPRMPICPEAMNGSDPASTTNPTTGSAISSEPRSAKPSRSQATEPAINTARTTRAVVVPPGPRVATELTTIRIASPTAVSNQCVSRLPNSAKKVRPR